MSITVNRQCTETFVLVLLLMMLRPSSLLNRNLLEYLPDWVCDSRKIEVLDVSHNLLSELPAR